MDVLYAHFKYVCKGVCLYAGVNVGACMCGCPCGGGGGGGGSLSVFVPL